MWGLKPHQQLARRGCRHSYGTCLGPAGEAGAWGGSHGSTAAGWGRFPAASQQWDLPAGGSGLPPAQVIAQPPHAGVCCPPSRQPQERAVAHEPPSCPPGA